MCKGLSVFVLAMTVWSIVVSLFFSIVFFCPCKFNIYINVTFTSHWKGKKSSNLFNPTHNHSESEMNSLVTPTCIYAYMIIIYDYFLMI